MKKSISEEIIEIMNKTEDEMELLNLLEQYISSKIIDLVESDKK